MKSIRTLAVTTALIAITMGPALAATPTTATTTEHKSSTKHMTWTKEQIKAAQQGLAKGGYYKGAVDGTWNKATESALKAWQKANKMPATGHLNEEELAKLQAA
jgi:peptidoglycan hydrolase-like protein with peptidoglycan-binding domain